MPSVRVLPTFVSKDADLKADLTSKELSARLTDNNKGANFSRLVAQHQLEKNKDHQHKDSQGKDPAEQDNKTAAIDSANITASGKTQVSELSDEEFIASQEADENKSLIASEEGAKLNSGNNEDARLSTNNSVDKQELLADKDKVLAEKNANDLSGKSSLAESEKFMSLLYQSDKALSVDAAKTSKDLLNSHSEQTFNTASLNSKQKTVEPALLNTDNETEKLKATSEQKLTALAKDERLAANQLTNNTALTSQLSGQTLKDYQLSLQSPQGAINNGSETNEQLTTAPLNSKMTEVAAGVSLASKSQLTENVNSGLYQRPVDAIGKTNLTASEILAEVVKTEGATTKNPNDKILAANNEANINKVGEPLKPDADVTKESLAKVLAGNSDTNINKASELLKPEVNTELDKTQLSKANIDKALAERTSSVLQQSQAQQAQLQKGQSQQDILSSSSEQHVPDGNSEEFIDAKLLAGDKPSDQNVKTVGPVVDNITMRSASELQAQAIQNTQAKQSNEAYFEHQSTEVLKHNIASDTAQIQKNNSQLQQETISIFRKDFAEAVKEKVLVTINQKLQRFDITLDPPEFGNMQVRVNLQGEQASVNFIVQNQQAKEALEQNMHKLRDMLSEQGVDVGGANVEQQGQQQSNNEQNLTSKQGNSSSLTNDPDNNEHNIEHILSTPLFNSSATGVDYYA